MPAMETGLERLNVKSKRQRERNGTGQQGEWDRPDRAVRTRCTLSCTCLQTQQQQQQQQPHRRELSNDSTESAADIHRDNFDLPQNMWHYLHRVGLGFCTPATFTTRLHASFSHTESTPRCNVTGLLQDSNSVDRFFSLFRSWRSLK